MGTENLKLHVLFFPFMAQGHLIPAVDMAKLFASHGVRATLLTTPLNVSKLNLDPSASVSVATIHFPAAAGLPSGCESMDSLAALREISGDRSPILTFLKATELLQDPLERILEEMRPDCVVADMFFPWATDSAGKFGIPRLVFHGTGVFSLCASESIRRYEPEKAVASDSEPFVIPNFPGEITMIGKQVPDFAGAGVAELESILRRAKESETRSFGVVVNSFHELESAYADHYREVSKRPAWLVGPLCLAGKNRGSPIAGQDCLKWLESKKPNSVIYICFGSMANFESTQLLEIAKALESSEQSFVWVVRRGNTDDPDWLPAGFEDRTAGVGLIIRGWAPQVEILSHVAVGAFVTHCGWNSTLEGVSAGLPMVTWPVSAEQFYNEKLITEVLGIGVAVGAEQWRPTVGDFVSGEKVERAVKAVMVGDEAVAMRSSAEKLGVAAREAVGEGGSSFCELKKLIQDLSTHKTTT